MSVEIPLRGLIQKTKIYEHFSRFTCVL